MNVLLVIVFESVTKKKGLDNEDGLTYVTYISESKVDKIVINFVLIRTHQCNKDDSNNHVETENNSFLLIKQKQDQDFHFQHRN